MLIAPNEGDRAHNGSAEGRRNQALCLLKNAPGPAKKTAAWARTPPELAKMPQLSTAAAPAVSIFMLIVVDRVLHYGRTCSKM